MPEPVVDMSAFVDKIGADLAAVVAPMLKRLEDDMAAKIAAATVKGGLIDRDGALILTFGDGSSRSFGVVVGRDGFNGRDGQDGQAGVDGRDGVDGTQGAAGRDGQDGAAGRDGFGFDDLDASLHSDGRTVVLSFTRGEVVHSFELPIPAMIYRGVYEGGRVYQPGDVVTFGGSGWVANVTTNAKPGETEKAWQLAIKRGRDGKDFAGLQIKAGA